MTISNLIARLEAASGPDRELDWRIAHIIGHESFDHPSANWPPFMTGSKADKAIPAYSASIDAAVAMAERVLPGWSWRVAKCSVSDDAWVIPDFNCPVHGERLRRELRQDIDWADITDVDLRLSGRPAIALCISILLARKAIDEGSFKAPEAASAKTGATARPDGKTETSPVIGQNR